MSSPLEKRPLLGRRLWDCLPGVPCPILCQSHQGGGLCGILTLRTLKSPHSVVAPKLWPPPSLLFPLPWVPSLQSLIKKSLFFLKIYCIEGWSMYNVVLISAPEHICTHTHTHTHTPYSLPHGVSQLNIPVPCGRLLPFIHPTYNSWPLLIPNSQSFPFPASLPSATTHPFSLSLWLFHRWVPSCHIPGSAEKWYRIVFVCLCLTDLI